MFLTSFRYSPYYTWRNTIWRSGFLATSMTPTRDERWLGRRVSAWQEFSLLGLTVGFTLSRRAFAMMWYPLRLLHGTPLSDKNMEVETKVLALVFFYNRSWQAIIANCPYTKAAPLELGKESRAEITPRQTLRLIIHSIRQVHCISNIVIIISVSKVVREKIGAKTTAGQCLRKNWFQSFFLLSPSCCTTAPIVEVSWYGLAAGYQELSFVIQSIVSPNDHFAMAIVIKLGLTFGCRDHCVIKTNRSPGPSDGGRDRAWSKLFFFFFYL